MTIHVGYLAIMRNKGTFCGSSQAFVRLMEVDEAILIRDGAIYYSGQTACDFKIIEGSVTLRDQRYFEINLVWDGDPDGDQIGLTRFKATMKAVRNAIRKADGEVAVIRDDLSSHYAFRSYPLIHEIENLMRRIIATFMLINIGREWVTDALPSDVQQAANNKKRKSTPDKEQGADYFNVLYALDFIHLGQILFDRYTPLQVQDLYSVIEDAKTAEDLESLRAYVPQSNWSRYFAKLIECEGDYLQTRWNKLYDLRCKVAHNATVTVSDHQEIVKLVDEIKPHLEQALAKLHEVKVPPDDIEVVAESAARNVNSAVGQFIASWQRLEASIMRRIDHDTTKTRHVTPTAEELYDSCLLDSSGRDGFRELRLLRNKVVHGPSGEIPSETILGAVTAIQALIETVESEPFLFKLKQMSDEDRHWAIDSVIADATFDLLDHEECVSAMATTNASMYSVDEYEFESIDLSGDECTVRMSFAATGESDEDRWFYGSRIIGDADAVIDSKGNVSFQNVHAAVDRDDGEEDDYYPPNE